MVRKKVYTKEQILKSAYQLVEKEGFANFTARHVASFMGISTQPLYLEFESMDDLKEQLLEQIFNELFTVTLREEYVADPLINIGIAFVNFARNNKKLFHTLFVDNYHSGQKMYDYSLKNYHKLVQESEKYKNLTEDQITFLHYRSWIVVTGIAVLTSSGIINYNVERLESVLSATINSLLKHKAILAK